jgi:bacillithiol biosynthesis deacetylase BshB1
MNSADVLAFGAHPDDVEIGCGGTVAKLADGGKRVVVVDLVRGELGTRGTAATREREAQAAAEILGLASRENLGLQDGHIRADLDSKRVVVEAIRRWQPEAVFLPYWRDRHPDHESASSLVYEAAFLAGLRRFETGQEPHRPRRLFYFVGWADFDPTFIVDITDQFDRKMESIYAFSTQFRPDASPDPQTDLTSPKTDWRIRSRCAYYGSLIDARYGEGFVIRGRMRAADPLQVDFRTF